MVEGMVEPEGLSSGFAVRRRLVGVLRGMQGKSSHLCEKKSGAKPKVYSPG
jgi:hypothetical protein